MTAIAKYKREDYNNVTIVDGDNSVSNSVYQEHANINKSSVNTDQTKVGSAGAGTSVTAGKVGGESATTTGSASTSLDAAKTTANLNGKAASKSINTVVLNQQNSEVSGSTQTGNKQATSNKGLLLIQRSLAKMRSISAAVRPWLMVYKWAVMPLAQMQQM